VPKPLPDARPMPAVFSPRRVRALLLSEATTWGWLWALVSNLLHFSMCAKGSGGQLEYLVPAGWAPVGPFRGPATLPGVYYMPQARGRAVQGFRGSGARGLGDSFMRPETRNPKANNMWVVGQRLPP
jgi:hypothetical protein